METPWISLSLIFSASYQTGDSTTESTECSLLSDMQYNCTAEFFNILSVTLESVSVTVSGPYGSASLSLEDMNQSQYCVHIICVHYLSLNLMLHCTALFILHT